MNEERRMMMIIIVMSLLKSVVISASTGFFIGGIDERSEVCLKDRTDWIRPKVNMNVNVNVSEFCYKFFVPSTKTELNWIRAFYGCRNENSSDLF